MIAVFVNCISVIVGSLVGFLFRKKVSSRYETVIFTAAGMVCILVGISMAMKMQEVLVFSMSLMFGGILGTFLSIEQNIEKFGEFLKKISKADKSEGNFTEGFLSSSILFCSGAMAIVGSFQAGTIKDYDIIYAKSAMDFFVAILMTSAYGIGVMFSSLSILIYQGTLTILSKYLEPYVTDSILAEVSSIGGAILLMVGLNLLKIKKINTGDFLPALIFAVILSILFPFIPFL